jgi:hypothetical protein
LPFGVSSQPDCFRNRPDIHKRLMIASCAVLFPPINARLAVLGFALPRLIRRTLPRKLLATRASKPASASSIDRRRDRDRVAGKGPAELSCRSGRGGHSLANRRSEALRAAHESARQVRRHPHSDGRRLSGTRRIDGHAYPMRMVAIKPVLLPGPPFRPACEVVERLADQPGAPFVAHLDLPRTTESYYKESARTG